MHTYLCLKVRKERNPIKIEQISRKLEQFLYVAHIWSGWPIFGTTPLPSVGKRIAGVQHNQLLELLEKRKLEGTDNRQGAFL